LYAAKSLEKVVTDESKLNALSVKVDKVMEHFQKEVIAILI